MPAIQTGSQSISFKGGTPQQQQLVTQAHARALARIKAAPAQVRPDAQVFKDWFGSGNAANAAGIIARFQAMAAQLEAQNFLYDLETYPSLEYVPGVFAMSYYEPPAGPITSFVPQAFWSRPPGPESDLVALARSICHESCALGGVSIPFAAADQVSAGFFAAYRPELALESTSNFMFFVEALALTDPSAGKDQP